MLSLAPSAILYVCTTPIDMRRSFNGLAIDARERVGGDPTSGSLFVFFNRNRTISKTIWWDTGGFCIFAKKLSKGRFKIPATPSSGVQHVEMDAKDVALLLAGIDLTRVKRQKRWNPKNNKKAPRRAFSKKKFDPKQPPPA